MRDYYFVFDYNMPDIFSIDLLFLISIQVEVIIPEISILTESRNLLPLSLKVTAMLEKFLSMT